MGIDLAGWARRHWFLPLFALLVALEAAFAASTDWAGDDFAEFAILFDMALVVPALHAFCYRRTLQLGRLLLRTAALACLGLYIASRLVPTDAQTLLGELLWLRTVGWVVLILVELWVAVVLIRLVLGNADTEEIARRSGAPLWIARLMQIEARFWRALWRLLSGRR